MPDYKRARSDEQKEERMSQIKKTADELFKTMPYTEINLSNIAEKLDWSRANLYKYVSTKEEIYLEITQDRITEYLNSLLTVFPEGCKFTPECVAEIWTAQVTSHEDYFLFYKLPDKPADCKALKKLKIKPKETNLTRDVKDFILMNIEWMKRKK